MRLTEKLLMRVLKDSEKPKRNFAIAEGVICPKCKYKKYCGQTEDKVSCEMYKPDKRMPKKGNRAWDK